LEPNVLFSLLRACARVTIGFKGGLLLEKAIFGYVLFETSKYKTIIMVRTIALKVKSH